MKQSEIEPITNLWIAIGAWLALVGGFWAYCETHFARADALNTEVESRKELKGEIDALYLKMIPDRDRAPLRHAEPLDR